MAIVWNQKTGKIGPALVKMSSSPAYTLAEVEQLAWQYADGSDASSNPWSSDAIRYRLYLGAFIAWLQRQEKEGGDGK